MSRIARRARLTEFAAAVVEAPVIAPAAPLAARWEGPIVFEGALTGDGRLLEHNSLRWENLPMTFRIVMQDVGAHDNAVAIGTIETMERQESGRIWATGTYDLESEAGREASRLVAASVKRGVSVDLDDMDFEVRIAKELMESERGLFEDVLIEDEDRPVDNEGRVTVATVKSDDEVMVITSALIRAATLVDTPALKDALISNVYDEPAEQDEETAVAASARLALVAGAAPVRPPLAWFRAPEVDGPTPIQITDDGRIYGHIAAWGTCHVGFVGQCVTPPKSAEGYAYFRTGAVRTAEGSDVATGVVTMDTLHANKRYNAPQTVMHYENTGLQVADVAVGEDEFGIWISGALRSDLSDEQVRRLRASPLSGDWREIGTTLELVAALAVSAPGFPIPRPQGLVASGGVVRSLVASGMVPPRQVLPPSAAGGLSLDDVRYLKRLAARQRADEAAALAVRVGPARAAHLARRVAAAQSSRG